MVTHADVLRAYPTGQDIAKLPRPLWTTYIRLGMADMQNAIEKAAEHAHLDAMKLLLRPCHDATYATLLNKVGPLECLDDDGEIETILESPLAHASRLGNLDMIKHLISIGADVNSDPYAFRDACTYDHLNAVEFFVRIGVNDDAKRSGFLFACFEGHLDVIQHLVNKGCRVDAECIGWAAQRGKFSKKNSLQIIKYLVSLGDCLAFDDILTDAIESEADLETIKYLVSLGAQKDEMGLIAACAMGDTEKAQFFALRIRRAETLVEAARLARSQNCDDIHDYCMKVARLFA
ncbi:ankyrin repeat-containing domain protein [Fimicolochytrium jonesii]|uniref:ankyrin repeat-containing domain protein n=1 Tax=Fimicolochytrium jonesii TaxID=1396493 RepID=UPI0022FDF5E4|nr:ankyrin repeat-containing domain protein [Fimicolochytrium jonesii]KAI8818702.1 ankyrin repeat-containing domain protein [Fimicolochytrium jonesii]